MSETESDIKRRLRISKLRCDLAIKTQQCVQIQEALNVLFDKKMDSETAVCVCDKIIKANIGP
jgi:hypothetical protein